MLVDLGTSSNFRWICCYVPNCHIKPLRLISTSQNNVTPFVRYICENDTTNSATQEKAKPARTDNSSSGLGASRPAATAPPPALARDSSALPGDATRAAMRLHALWMCATRTVRSAAAPAWPMCSSSVGGDAAAAAAAIPSVAAASGWQTKARRRVNGARRRRRCGGGRFEVGGSERGGWWPRMRREERDDNGIVSAQGCMARIRRRSHS